MEANELKQAIQRIKQLKKDVAWVHKVYKDSAAAANVAQGASPELETDFAEFMHTLNELRHELNDLLDQQVILDINNTIIQLNGPVPEWLLNVAEERPNCLVIDKEMLADLEIDLFVTVEAQAMPMMVLPPWPRPVIPRPFETDRGEEQSDPRDVRT